MQSLPLVMNDVDKLQDHLLQNLIKIKSMEFIHELYGLEGCY